MGKYYGYQIYLYLMMSWDHAWNGNVPRTSNCSFGIFVFPSTWYRHLSRLDFEKKINGYGLLLKSTWTQEYIFFLIFLTLPAEVVSSVDGCVYTTDTAVNNIIRNKYIDIILPILTICLSL